MTSFHCTTPRSSPKKSRPHNLSWTPTAQTLEGDLNPPGRTCTFRCHHLDSSAGRKFTCNVACSLCRFDDNAHYFYNTPQSFLIQYSNCSTLWWWKKFSERWKYQFERANFFSPGRFNQYFGSDIYYGFCPDESEVYSRYCAPTEDLNLSSRETL